MPHSDVSTALPQRHCLNGIASTALPQQLLHVLLHDCAATGIRGGSVRVGQQCGEHGRTGDLWVSGRIHRCPLTAPTASSLALSSRRRWGCGGAGLGWRVSECMCGDVAWLGMANKYEALAYRPATAHTRDAGRRHVSCMR